MIRDHKTKQWLPEPATKEGVDLYAIGIVTGTTAGGDLYANVQVHHDQAARSSYWSIYLDTSDETELELLNIEDIQKFVHPEGKRKITRITPVKFRENCRLFCADIAPCYRLIDGKYKMVDHVYVVEQPGENGSAAVDRAIRRTYENADGFYDSPKHFVFYEEFVGFRLTRDELKSLLRPTEEDEDQP